MKNTFRMVVGAATALALSMGTMQANAQVAYFEDFNGKSTADLESAGWVFEVVNGAEENDATAITVEFGMDRTRDTNPVGENGLQTTGEYLMSDADRFSDGDQNLDIDSGQSYDATTPSIDCSGLSQVWVQGDFSVILNNNGSAVFMIDVSVGGGDWITKEIRVAPARFPGESFQDIPIREDDPFKAVPGKDGNMGAIHGRHYVDITAEAAGQSDVRLRFRHYEEDWDWWIAIDNLQVSSTPRPGGSEVAFGPVTFDSDLDGFVVAGDVAIGDPFAHKDDHFVSGDPNSDPDYIVSSDNGNTLRHADGRSLNRLAGQGYAIFLALGEGLALAGDFSTLDSPSIDLSGFSSVVYHAWVEFLSTPDVPFSIQVSTDGGSSFENIYVTHEGLRLREDAYAMQLAIPVPQAAGQSDVIFRVQAEVLADNGNAFFAIDDITITNGSGAAPPPPPSQVTLSLPVFEDFEGLTLGDSVEEEVPGTGVWTKTAPAGWGIDDSGVFGAAEGLGVDEWAGWSFANKDWWAETAGDQRRTEFANASGTVAVVDPDEWDDIDDPDSQGSYTSFLSTPNIDLGGAAANSVVLNFDSSYRQEEPTEVNITVSYDGGAAVEVLRWTWVTDDPNFHEDSPNENVTVSLNNPTGASNAVVTFGIIEARNDWWWALDNISISTGTDVSGWELY